MIAALARRLWEAATRPHPPRYDADLREEWTIQLRGQDDVLVTVRHYGEPTMEPELMTFNGLVGVLKVGRQRGVDPTVMLLKLTRYLQHGGGRV